MKVQNIQYHKGLSQEDYFKLPGVSFSKIKSEGVENFVETENMKLGTLVHRYLLEPHEYEHQADKQVRALAVQAKKTIGSLIDYCEPEVGVTAEFVHGGFTLQYKGRMDLRIHKKIVIDFKFIGGNSIKSTMDMFGYEDQQSGYAIANECSLAIIIAINRKNLNTEVVKITPKSSWWDNIILTKGRPNI